MHSFRVGGAVSQVLAGTSFDALMDFVGWKTRSVAQRYVGPQPSAVAARQRSGGPAATPLEVEARYNAADGLPLQDGFEERFAAFQ